jgi:hypothetical protein
MKARLNLCHVTIEIDGETQKDLFENVASAYEVFNEHKCGLCGCEDIRPVVRRVTQKKKECLARLAISSNMVGGTLFPCRKLLPNGKPSNAEGKWGGHNGWSKYKGEPTDEE